MAGLPAGGGRETVSLGGGSSRAPGNKHNRENKTAALWKGPVDEETGFPKRGVFYSAFASTTSADEHFR